MPITSSMRLGWNHAMPECSGVCIYWHIAVHMTNNEWWMDVTLINLSQSPIDLIFNRKARRLNVFLPAEDVTKT